MLGLKKDLNLLELVLKLSVTIYLRDMKDFEAMNSSLGCLG